MNYQIRIKDTKEEAVLTVRTHTSLAKLGEAMAHALQAIGAAIQPKGVAPVGPPFAVYHNAPFTPEDVDVEMGVPISRAVPPTNEELHVEELHPTKVAYTLHEGDYANIGAAYAALYDWLHRSGRRAAGPPREIYLVGPNAARDARDYRTEIDLPIA